MVKAFAKIEGGKISDFADEVRKVSALAMTTAITSATETLKDAMRTDIASAALGEKLGRAVGSRIYPRTGVSLAAAGIVFPRGSKAEHIMQAWNDGATITATGGRKWLAVPTPAAGKGFRGASITPQKFRERTGIDLRFIPVRGKANVALLVGRAGSLRRGKKGKEEVFFVLIKQSVIPARLHFDALAQAVAEQIPSLIDREMPNG